MSLLTLQNLKDWGGVDYSERDTVLQIALDGAEEWIGRYCGVDLDGAVEYTDYIDGGGKGLWPRHRPLLSISSVYDTEALLTEPAANYVVQNNGIFRIDADRWEKDPVSRWRVIYTAGFTAASLPAGLKLGILTLAARAINNTDDKSAFSSEGYRIDYAKFADGDLRRDLSMYRMKGGFFG